MANASDNTTDPRVTKRKVTMRSARLLADGALATEEASDYVKPEHLDAYVADAQTRWQYVAVEDEPDAGPGGYHGQTAVPEALDVPDAGTVYAATTED